MKTPNNILNFNINNTKSKEIWNMRSKKVKFSNKCAYLP